MDGQRRMKQFVGSCFVVLGLSACGGSVPTTTPSLSNGAVPLVNPSFDLTPDGSLAGWEANEHSRGKSFSFTADASNMVSAPASASINRYGDEAWGLLRQTLPVKTVWIGKTARLSGSLKSEGADSFGAGLLLQTRTSGEDVLTYNHMSDRRLMGTQAWAKYSVEIKIPPQAFQFNLGIILEGGGTLWADDIQLEIID